MREITRKESAGRIGQLAFMAAVTALLVALTLRAAAGPGGIAAATVYAFAAGFGLEFVGSAWTGRGKPPAGWRADRGRW
jgi:hypothetical protein